ncbi:COP9 signalosome complex subunit 3 [Striga hermonthica]|uniref:COP9 signalosome complex subunit 3 n=1 Tax=Striga hermonthica TaxID=68872 RepID=A0A9N7RC10_STRHE|nr:COP9 signalosome complex subunit 3 [Striga hermonthica]
MNLDMSSVESVEAQIQGLSGGELTQLHNYLKQIDDTLRSEPTQLAPLLSELDPCTHSLGYLFVLDALASAAISKDQINEIVLSVAKFINVCAVEQIRLAPVKFISPCKRLKDQVMLLGRPNAWCCSTIDRSSTEQLFTLHPDFLHTFSTWRSLLLCLLSKSYKTRLSILEDEIFEVDQPRDFFLYCYYGGMICVGQKKFSKALELLHNFSTTFPKYTSSAAQRNLKNLTQPYLELVNVYSTGKVSDKDKFASD